MLKNKKLTQKDLCDKWLANKTINPETSRKIKENGDVYKKLEKKCSLKHKQALNLIFLTNGLLIH